MRRQLFGVGAWFGRRRHFAGTHAVEDACPLVESCCVLEFRFQRVQRQPALLTFCVVTRIALRVDEATKRLVAHRWWRRAGRCFHHDRQKQ